MDRDFMDPEFAVDEPVGKFGTINANDMELDELPLNESPEQPSTVNSAKIDLDTTAADYTGYALMNRLLFIADVCPPLRFDALKMLIDYVIKHTQNIPMLMSAYQSVEKAKLASQTGSEKIPPIDNQWMDHTSTKSQSQIETYLAELKRQKSEAVKESIRRSLEDVFHQYVEMGNIQEALKLYSHGMREYCTSPNYVLQMLIKWINVTVYANQWPKLCILLPQAERAISEVVEREKAAAITGASSRQVIVPTGYSSSSHMKNYKELVESSKAKISAVSGLAKMQGKEYREAAEKFITVDIDALEYPELLSAGDVAVYGTLCALATFSRSELKDKVLGSTLFRKFLESEPKLVELLQKFGRSEFGSCLDILNEMRDSLLLNMFLAQHVNSLYALIRESAIVQHFTPYVTARINNMAIEFRSTAADMENELISLIEKGLLNARIDSYTKILHANFADNRKDIYKRVLSLTDALDHRVYAILLRSALQNHKINVGWTNKGGAGGGKGRRRANQNVHYDEDEMWMGEQENNSGGSSGPNTSRKMISQVSRLFNAATSRIHQTSLVESSSSGAQPSNTQNSNGEIIPTVPTMGTGAAQSSTHSESVVPPDCSNAGKSGGSGSRDNPSDDMEMDDDLGDI